MALALVQRYKAPDLAVQVDSGARAVLPGTNVTFSTDPVTGAITINATGGGGTGTVTSVGLSAPTGLSVSGSPVTASGTLTLTYTAGYQGYTTTEASKLAGIAPGATANTGTVTSVGLTGSTGLAIGGVNPVTTSGTITATLSANLQAWSGVTTASKANVASPTFTGTPAAPTPATADNTTKIATTAYVKAQGYATTVSLGSYVLKAGDTMTGQLFINTTSIPLRMRSPTTTNASANFDIGQNTTSTAGDTNGYVIARVGGIDFYTANTARGQMTAAGDLSWNTTITAEGTITSGQNFQSSTTAVVVQPTGAGTVYLRPNQNSASGQTTVSAAGDMAVSGSVATPSLVLSGGKKLTKISLGTTAPGALADGELYLRY